MEAKLKTIRIGTRGSKLALWQAHFTQKLLSDLGIDSELVIIKTYGDQNQVETFEKMEGKGVFTKEIEAALLDNRIDVAVHSHKDLETASHEKLSVAAVSYREDPRDILLIRKAAFDSTQKLQVKENAVVGTSSVRRYSQLKSHRSDIVIEPLRGNVPTRINKLREGNYDAIVLAAAGIKRLEIELQDIEVVELPPKLFIPAPAQGVLAWQTRKEDTKTNAVIEQLNHSNIAEEIDVERQILKALEGGCSLPFGAFCQRKNGQFHLLMSFAKERDKQPIKVHLVGNNADTLIDSALKLANRKINVPSLYISKQLPYVSYLQKQSTLGNISGVPQIKVEFNQLTDLPLPDWVFCTSKNAVKSLVLSNQIESNRNKKWGCTGSSTEEALRSLGIEPQFVGTENLSQSADEFAQVVGEASVLFPVSNRSVRRFQEALPADQVREIVGYEIQLQPVKVDSSFDYLWFTSPSNFEAYIQVNQIQDGQELLAFGKTTADIIREHLPNRTVNLIEPEHFGEAWPVIVG